MLAAKLLFIESYYFLLVQLLNDLYQQSLFVCSCSKRAQGSAIKHQQGIKYITITRISTTITGALLLSLNVNYFLWVCKWNTTQSFAVLRGGGVA